MLTPRPESGLGKDGRHWRRDRSGSRCEGRAGRGRSLTEFSPRIVAGRGRALQSPFCHQASGGDHGGWPVTRAFGSTARRLAREWLAPPGFTTGSAVANAEAVAVPSAGLPSDAAHPARSIGRCARAANSPRARRRRRDSPLQPTRARGSAPAGCDISLVRALQRATVEAPCGAGARSTPSRCTSGHVVGDLRPRSEESTEKARRLGEFGGVATSTAVVARTRPRAHRSAMGQLDALERDRSPRPRSASGPLHFSGSASRSPPQHWDLLLVQEVDRSVAPPDVPCDDVLVPSPESVDRDSPCLSTSGGCLRRVRRSDAANSFCPPSRYSVHSALDLRCRCTRKSRRRAALRSRRRSCTPDRDQPAHRAAPWRCSTPMLAPSRRHVLCSR